MKAVSLSFFAVAFLFANLAYAQNFNQSQQSVGPTEHNASSANYQLKATAAEAGGDQSKSSNYIYDHGTWWAGSSSVPPPPPPPSGGGGGGGGTGSGSGSGAGGGGGQTTSPAEEDGVGGATPTIDAIDTPTSEEAVEEALPAREITVPRQYVPATVKRSLDAEYPFPEIIRGVDEQNVVREVAVVMMARVVPLPLWLALILLLAGISALLLVRGEDMEKRRGNLWLASGLIVAGLAVGWATRVIYQDEIRRFDETKITSSITVLEEKAAEAVKNVVMEKEIGVYNIIVVDEYGYEKLQITIYVKGTLPI